MSHAVAWASRPTLRILVLFQSIEASQIRCHHVRKFGLDMADLARGRNPSNAGENRCTKIPKPTHSSLRPHSSPYPRQRKRCHLLPGRIRCDVDDGLVACRFKLHLSKLSSRFIRLAFDGRSSRCRKSPGSVANSPGYRLLSRRLGLRKTPRPSVRNRQLDQCARFSPPDWRLRVAISCARK